MSVLARLVEDIAESGEDTFTADDVTGYIAELILDRRVLCRICGYPLFGIDRSCPGWRVYSDYRHHARCANRCGDCQDDARAAG